MTEALHPGQPDKFQPLRDAYGAALPQRVAEICDGWAGLARGGGTAVDWREFQRLVHTIAGSAGTFGFHALSDKARELEDLLNELDDGPKEERAAEIEPRLAALRSLAQGRDAASFTDAKAEKR